MKHNLLRPAIAMIELIFAIVVMGIVMMSAPMLISTASQSSYVAIQQEGIAEVSSQLNIILGYQWDENNTNPAYDPLVLDTNSTNLEESGTSGRRAGTPVESFRKYLSSAGERGTATAVSALGSDATDQDDMDDFNDNNTSLQEILASNTSDYIEKDTININRVISYMSDAESGTGTYLNGGTGTLSFTPFGNTATTSNIKQINVTLTSTSSASELSKTISLRAFSCNIGSYKLEER